MPSKASIAPAAITRSQVSNPSATDYVSIAIAYAEEAVEDQRGKWACQWIRLASRRFLKDLVRTQGKRPPFHFSAKRANRHCAFIENMPHVEGEWDSPLIILQPAQIFFVVQLFGFRAIDGGRRFSEALLAIARKNAKSTLAAAIELSCLCLEHEEGAQILSAATTGSQARIPWAIAKRMIEKTPELAEEFDLEALANSITREQTGGVFKPINSKASTQDGLNPSVTGLDEIHAHKNHDLLNVLRSAAGARRNPLWLYTTTEGYESPGPWPELRNFARQILLGLFKADHFLACIWALDDDDPEESDFDEQKWIKANPLLPVNPILLRELRKLAANARAMPGTHAEFRIKRLNRPAASASGWTNLTKWRQCSGPVDRDALVAAGAQCWGALDLASTADMCAWRLLWLLDGHFYTWGRYWVPTDAVRQRTERRSVPYASWIAGGFIAQTTGDVTDYAAIEQQIVEDFGRYAPQRIAFDPWNATHTVNNLLAQGLPMELFIQGPRSFNPAMNACEIAYKAKRLSHGGDPVLTWNMANVVARRDVNLNLAPDRKKSADKIDGAVALFMTFGLAQSDDAAGFDHYLSNVVSV